MKKLFVLAAAMALVVASCAKDQHPTTASSAGKPGTASTPSTAPEKKNLGSPSPSASVDGLTVLEAVACKSVENRNPVGAAEKFPTNVGRLYVFTKLTLNGTSESSVKHIWKHNGKDLATVTLPVRGPQWRTYSSKTIDPSQTGDWTVDILNGSAVVKTVAFRIE
jgi:hypothetical protein